MLPLLAFLIGGQFRVSSIDNWIKEFQYELITAKYLLNIYSPNEQTENQKGIWKEVFYPVTLRGIW